VSTQDLTPEIHSENKKPDGLATQVGRGEFKLNPRRAKAAPKRKPAAKKLAAA
jgi:hypothetical protein